MIAFDVADLFDWLGAQSGWGAVVTMLPDAAELDMADADYRRWLASAATRCFAASAGPTVFAITDRMRDGEWVDKAALITNAGRPNDAPMLWHKIALRRAVGTIDLHRPTYSHILAYGPGRPGRRRPDVIDGGPRSWPNAVGAETARFVAEWFRDVGVRRVLNPAGGAGTFALACDRVGLETRACDVERRGVWS